MSKLFRMDSPLMRFLTKIADLMVLNILFCVTSIPLITIGASWTALYSVTLKMVRDEEGSVSRSYFRSFRQNFRQATLLWLGVPEDVLNVLVYYKFHTVHSHCEMFS